MPMKPILVLSTLLLGSAGAFASETDWARQFAGLDGVAVSCKDHSDGGYGKKLCTHYLDSVEKALAGADVPHAIQGYFRHDETQPGKPEGFANPLNLKLFIRGTAGDSVAIQLRGRASVTYTAAVEKGGAGQGRSGELVIWERSVTGSGPSGQLQSAIAEAMVSRSQGLVRALTTDWPRQQ